MDHVLLISFVVFLSSRVVLVKQFLAIASYKFLVSTCTFLCTLHVWCQSHVSSFIFIIWSLREIFCFLILYSIHLSRKRVSILCISTHLCCVAIQMDAHPGYQNKHPSEYYSAWGVFNFKIDVSGWFQFDWRLTYIHSFISPSIGWHSKSFCFVACYVGAYWRLHWDLLFYCCIIKLVEL